MEKVPSPQSEADQHQEMSDKIEALQNGNKQNTQETKEKGIPTAAETNSTTTETETITYSQTVGIINKILGVILASIGLYFIIAAVTLI